jgi:transposase
MRYALTDCEWFAIRPMLPNKPRGIPRVNDRRVLNGIFWICAPAHRGGTCPEASGRIPPAIIASFAGGGLVSGAES